MGYASSVVQRKAVVVVVSFVASVVLLTVSLQLQPGPLPGQAPKWFGEVSKEYGRRLKVGLVNVDVRGLEAEAEVVRVRYERAGMGWEELYPEGEAAGCPEMPMPERMEELYGDLDVVVVAAGEGWGAVGRLQANLVAANVAVSGGGWALRAYEQQAVYVVVVGEGVAMPEIFRCQDMVLRGDAYQVYRPDLTRLKQITLMPVGACLLPPGISTTESYGWRYFSLQTKWFPKKEAYVTTVHSSEEEEAHVCGAIALAQSIKESNSTRDLVLLADRHISPASRHALALAGWDVREMEPIHEWKLRIWQLTIYDTLVFIDSDSVVLSNLDYLFRYPELSAAPTSSTSMSTFSSGVMVVEPSQCMFDALAGDLNQAFRWWHRLPTSLTAAASTRCSLPTGIGG